MKKIVEVKVETQKDGFTCYLVNSNQFPINFVGDGETVKDAINDFEKAHQFAAEFAKDSLNIDLYNLQFHYNFDVPAFFNYFPINISKFAEFIGMRPALLKQYITNTKAPSQKIIDKINEGKKQLAWELI